MAANTLYTFTITPDTSIGAAYSFSFTTGGSADTTAPHLVSIDPPSGTTGIGLSGPFTIHFDKRLSRIAQQSSGIAVTALPASANTSPSYTLSDDGTSLIVRVSPSQNYPSGYRITVDPSHFVDVFGNVGQGAPVTAQYLTFVTTDSSGPHLNASLPANGDTGVPTNIKPRLVFQKVINEDSATNGIQLLSGGVAQAFAFTFVSGYNGTEAVTISPNKLLAPNQTYSIVVNSSLLDPSGFPVQQPQTIQFTTGDGPDPLTPTVVAYSPSVSSVPPDTRVTIQANKPIAPMVLDRIAPMGLIHGYPATTVPVSATLSPDGTLLTMAPQSPLSAGSYSFNTVELIDTAGATFTFSGGISFTVSGDIDLTPLAVLAVNPPPDSATAPVSSAIQIRFNKVCANCLFPGVIAISTASGTLASKISSDYGAYNIGFTLNAGGLSPSTTYTISLSGAQDLAGNAMADTSFSFTTAGGPATAASLTLLSSSVNNGDTGVNPAGPFVLQFDSILNPVSAVTAATVTGPGNFSYPVTGSASGSTLTIVPVLPLPANTSFYLYFSVSSLSGSATSNQIRFTTAASADTAPLVVSAISPGDGTLLPRASTSFVLTFSKPLNPSTVTSGSISLYSSGNTLNPALVRSEDNRSVSFTMPSGQSWSTFTLIAASALKDLAGNSLVPFEANYQVTPDTMYSASTPVHEMRPASGTTDVAADTAITLFLDQPVDLAAVQADLVVLADQAPFPGSFDLAGGGRILRFSPAAPFPAGAVISFYERNALLGLTRYTTPSFTIAAAADSSLRVLRTTIGTSTALDSVLEVEFTADPPLGKSVASLSFSPGDGSSTPLAFTESIPRPHVLRVTTTAPRKAGYYNLTLTNSLGYYYGRLGSTTLGGTATVVSAGPAAGATGVPVNASVRVLFGAAINPLTVTAQSAVLSVGGTALPVQRTYPSNNREIVLRPCGALPANTRVDVALTGLEDLAGHPFPALSWSFTTGTDPDYIEPSVLSTSLPNANSGGAFQVAPNEAIQLVFSEPMDPGLSLQVSVSYEFNNAVNTTWSADLRTLTIAPVGAWAEGQSYNLYLQNVLDLSGNPGSSTGLSPSFQVAFAASTTPPNLLAISPPDGATAMPLNARVMAAFDKPVSLPPGGVSLVDSAGNPVPLAAVSSSDPSRPGYAPLNALRPNTSYTLSLSGATDLSGNVMQSAAKASFVTGADPDYVAPVGTVEIVSPAPTNMPLRIYFSKPVSPATVTPRQIQLLQGNTAQPASTVLSGDGLSVTINPAQPLTVGRTYTLAVNGVADFAGNAASFTSYGATASSIAFVAGASADTTPPAISFFPPDGTVGFPVNFFYANATTLSVTFSKPVDTAANPPQLRVFENGNPVAGTVSISSTGLTFTSSQLLDYNATYRMEVSNVADYCGNAAATASATFTTSASLAADHGMFQVVSVQPADGSVGIDSSSPVSATFSKLLPRAVSTFQIRSSSALPVMGTWSSSGYTETFTPGDPWPSAATISVAISYYGSGGYFRDQSGTVLGKEYAFSFTTAVQTDNTPPALLSITPAPGTSLSPTNTTFTLVFSKPVVVGSQALQGFNGTQAVSISTYYNRTATTIGASVYPTASNVFTIVGTTGIHDDAGNPIQPFSFQYQTLKYNETANPTVVSISPDSFTSNVAPSTPIKIQFNKAMDPTSLLASVHVTQDGAEISGQLQMQDANHSIQFTPNAPYKAGSRIDVFVFATAADPNGAPLNSQYGSYFKVAAATAALETRMTVAFAGFGQTVVPDAGLDLAFDRELDASTVSEANVWLRAGHTRIPGAVSLRNGRTLRFQPAEPLRVGEEYVLTAGPNLRSADGLSTAPREFRFQVDATPLAVRVESVEYLRDQEPLTVRIRFTGPVSPVSADGLKLLAPDGSALAADASFSTDGREWLLRLATRQPVRVVLDGIEDRWGRKLPRESRDPVVAR